MQNGSLIVHDNNFPAGTGKLLNCSRLHPNYRSSEQRFRNCTRPSRGFR